MTKNKKFIYLLGGCDLEMSVIRKILNEHGCSYYDCHLMWNNAFLSAYKEYLNKFGNNNLYQIIGIELEEDITPPVNYISIDHHNYNDKNLSALEQIAKILDVQLNRYEQLVAANDRAYIPGMIALHASDKEIEKIRSADRICQGVTVRDEVLAEKAIKENIKHYNNSLIVVYALSSKFSPICDRLFPYKQLLIYTDKEWVYYGYQIKTIIELLKIEIQKGNIFYGGGINGYIGCKNNKYTKTEILYTVNRIINQLIY